MKTTPPEEALFQAAIALEPGQRAAFLDRECDGNPALRARLDALLAAHDQSDTVPSPADGLPGSLLGPDPDRDSGPDAVGLTLGRYKILERLGEGGCGVVYVAEQTEPVRRRVALKLVKPGMDSKAVIARFEAERQALAMMDHSNIAKVFDAGTTNTGRPYFVMELVRGIRITDYCDREKLGIRDRLDLFVKVCQAIQHAHQKGIIHRDIKPSNILVTLHDGVPVPKVIDFGIAKATEGRLTDATVYTQLHQFLGTPAYMSPEQAEMSGLDIDTRSDIYSLGVLLYELLTGVTPFDARELMSGGLDAMRRIIREKEPPRPSTRLTQLQLTRPAERTAGRLAPLPADLDWIVMKCLEKDRSRRYESATGLASDLRRHLSHEPVEARPPGTAYRLHKAWQRHRLAFSAAAAIAAVLLASVVVLSRALRDESVARESAESSKQEEGLHRIKAEAARAVASAERDRTARLLAATHAAQGVELLEKSDPVGLLHLLEACKTVDHLPEERSRFTQLWSGWREALPKPEARTLSAGTGVSSVGISPGPPWIVLGGTNGDVVIQQATTGEEIGRFNTGKGRIFAPEFSSNGRFLILKAGGTEQLWDLGRTGTNGWPTRLLGRVLRYAFDPARRLLVTLSNESLPIPGEPSPPVPSGAASAGFQLQVWNPHLDDPHVRTWDGDRHDLANQHFAVSPDGNTLATAGEAATLWDLATGRPQAVQVTTNGVAGKRGFFDPLWYSPNGRFLWEVRGTECARYDAATGQRTLSPFAGLSRKSRPWVSPNGRHLVVTLEAGHRVVELDTGEFLGLPIPQQGELAGIPRALTVDGATLATSGSGSGVLLWDIRTGRELGPPAIAPDGIAQAAFTPDGAWLAIVTHEGWSQIRRVGLPEPTTFRNWPGLWFVGSNAEGHALVYSGSTRTLGWIEPWTGAPLGQRWELGTPGKLIGAALRPDGRVVATASEVPPGRSAVRLWDAATGQPTLAPIAWTNLGVLAFSADGRQLAGLGGDGSIQTWDATTGEAGSTMGWREPAQVTWIGLRFSPDARFLAARNSYTISVWDVAERRLANGLERDLYLAVSQDWTLALTDRDLLDFRDPRRPQPAPQPPTRREAPAERGGFAISPDGRLRASSVGAKGMRIWDIGTGRPVGKEMRCEGIPTRMEFGPDSRLLAVFEIRFEARPPSPRYAIRLWETSTGLPCGPAIAMEDQPVEFWFDLERRWLTTSTLYDPDGMRVLRLPAREWALADMERETWQVAGGRLDETGNLELRSR